MFLLVTSALLKAGQADAKPDDVHVERYPGYGADDPTTLVMYCGAVAIIADDLSIVPYGFDWVFPPNAERATCRPCRLAFGLGEEP